MHPHAARPTHHSTERHRSIPNRQPESIIYQSGQAELFSSGLGRRCQAEFRTVQTFLSSWPLGHEASRQCSKSLSTQGITGSSRPAATCPRSRLFLRPASTHASVRGLQRRVSMSLAACHRRQDAYRQWSVARLGAPLAKSILLSRLAGSVADAGTSHASLAFCFT